MRGTRLFFTLFILTLIGCTHTQNQPAGALKTTTASGLDPNWTLLPFVKIDSVNPILGPGSGSFIDPILHKRVLWEAKDVFNPAIVNRMAKYTCFTAPRIKQESLTARRGSGWRLARMLCILPG